MRAYLRGCFVAVLLFGAGAPARADFIFSKPVSGGGGAPIVAADIRVRLVFTPDPYDLFQTPLLDLHLTPADVGKTFAATAATPNFATNIGYATDGQNGRVFFAVGIGESFGADGWFDKGFFYNAPHAPSTVGPFDLQGATIDRVTLTVTDLTMASPGQDPGKDGIWTDYAFKGVVTFEGQPPPLGSPGSSGSPSPSPEPGGIWLGLCGMLGAVACAAGRSRRGWSGHGGVQAAEKS
jgi:hypothetical protein